ncbi:MAG: DUF5110 domain-containing protein, partial [Calditrichaeota bacterium]|nr:DUF5110 domain-containing protein [Calditrichota bacterium]
RQIIGMAVLFFLLTAPVGAEPTNPVANPEAMIVLKHARFTVLTPRVIRMEWSPTGQFEDHATLVFINRNLPVPVFKKSKHRGWLKVQTSALTLFYKIGSGPFTKKNLRIDFRMGGKRKTWHPGMKNKGNLKGTTRTLDGCDGDSHYGRKIDLGQGLISRDGWVLIDDSKRPIFDQSDWPWVQPRPKNDKQDFYFFGYGFDYKAALHDFVLIAGRIPIPPRFAFGIWWSRYWEYTDKGLRELVHGFQTHRIPLDVLVVDIDWHIRFLPEWFDSNGKLKRDQAGQSAGWTGFTWDTHYFPDPKDFLDWTERESLKVCLNLHPAAGIQPHEAVYPEMARAMGIDPNSKKYVPFDIVNKKFAENFMNLVLHPLEKEGVDFWWLDWQQWSTTKIPGVNPTFYLNYVFFSDMAREGKRPLIFHRYGGLGNHRYQIGFSGDTKITWKSLTYQPYFTVTAANVGFGYWSHDIGGHMHGPGTPELYTRWIQWGAFSPIFRTHCTKSAKIERRIWAYPLPYYNAMRKAELQRHRLIPYIYSYARKTYESGISLCHPLYYEFPQREEAYRFPDEYYFGDDLIVAPVTHPMGRDSLFTWQTLWLPPGKWLEWATGTLLEGNRIVKRAFMLDDIPVYVKAGAIVPEQPALQPAQTNRVNPLTLVVFPGDSGRTVYYEDEGNTNGYRNGLFAKTPIHFRYPDARTLRLVIEPVQGHFPGMESQRAYVMRFPNTFPPERVTVNGHPLSHSRYDRENHWTYSDTALGLQIHTLPLPVSKRVVVDVRFSANGAKPLSGVKGQVKRLMTLTKFIAIRGNWNRAKYPKTIVVRPAQLGLILAQNPEKAETEIRKFPGIFKRIIAMVAEEAQQKPQLKPYFELLKATNP